MFQGQSFNRLQDFTADQLLYLIDFAAHLKQLKKQHIPHPYLQGQNIALIFDKASTRTRAAFTVAANDLGAYPEYLGPDNTQFGKKESVMDSAIVFGSMFDAIEMRVSSQATIDTFVEHAGVPIWNGMSDEWHPTQILADYLTIKEHFGTLEGQKLVYCGDGRNNMAHSLLMMGAIVGMDTVIASPDHLQPAPEVLKEAQRIAAESGAQVTTTADIQAAVVDATVIYTDVWASMGEEDTFAERIQALQPYQVNEELVSRIKGEYIFLHCLPSFHNDQTVMGQQIKEQFGLAEMEVTDAVFNSPASLVFEQAENRLHSIKAVMAATAGHLYIPERLAGKSR